LLAETPIAVPKLDARRHPSTGNAIAGRIPIVQALQIDLDLTFAIICTGLALVVIMRLLEAYAGRAVARRTKRMIEEGHKPAGHATGDSS
jgi:hypothetical protein